jgi:anti-sigma regulatory factor (Ser/Thr protein kinase)
VDEDLTPSGIPGAVARPPGPGVARVTLRAVLDAHGLAPLVDRAELLASELATNSVRHTKGPASVLLQ